MYRKMNKLKRTKKKLTKMVPEEFLRDFETVSESSKCLKKCPAALSWRERKLTEKLQDIYLRMKFTSKYYRRYFPSPRPPDGPFVVDPAYANLSLRKKSPLPGTSKVPKSILKSSSSRQSSPIHSAPSVTPTHIHVNSSAISNKPKINYKDEGNRYYSYFDREEPSTSYQFQSASSFPRSVLKKSKSKYSSTEYRSNITNVPIQRRESRSIHRDFSALKRRSASLDYYRAPQSYDRTYSLPRRNRPRYLCISPIRIPRDKIKYKKSLANSIPVSSHVYSNESIHDLPYLYLSSDYPYFLRLPPLAIGESPPPSPAPNPSALFGQSYIPDEDLYRFGRYPLYYSTPTTPEPVDPAVNPFLNYRDPKKEYITDEEPEEPIRSCSPTSPSPFFPCDSYSNWYYSNYNSWKPRRSSGRPRKSMGRMNAVDQERKIIIEFCHLLEKSKQLFNGLRELPQYGHKQWHSYFGRTFDVYTKLWKFQQQHRDILDKKYGLKRWQIGEIASKIGQLYYHFYLRTSDTTYLHEAYSFYHAIRARCYYTKASEEDRCELMVKKLRYYARFIVVGLLLKKIKLVRELAKELDRQIIEYANTYDPTDQVEWTVVVDEVKAFIQAEPILSIIHPENYCVTLSHRLAYNSIPPLERTNQQPLSLQEVLIVGNNIHQVKFSELTMDMFRILQTLERESAADIQHMFEESPKQKYMSTPCAPSKGPHLDGSPRRDNPHKYLLFKPAPSQVLVYLGSGCHDLPPGGVLLLYISADGQGSKSTQQTVDDASYNMGGVVTTSRSDSTRDNRDMKDLKNPPQKVKEPQCLYPGDLYAYTRRPLFLVIDSDNSYVFQNMPRNFGQPMVVLMSPLEMPPQYHARKHQGNLFTLFLHSPLTAICFCCEVHTMSLAQWERAQTYVDTFMIEVSQIFTRFRVDAVYLSFMCDDFLRLLVFRYIFTEVALRNHTSFKNHNQLPRAMPPLPEDLIEHPSLFHIILDLAAYLQVRHQFAEQQAGPSSSQKE